MLLALKAPNARGHCTMSTHWRPKCLLVSVAGFIPELSKSRLDTVFLKPVTAASNSAVQGTLIQACYQSRGSPDERDGNKHMWGKFQDCMTSLPQGFKPETTSQWPGKAIPHNLATWRRQTPLAVRTTGNETGPGQYLCEADAGDSDSLDLMGTHPPAVTCTDIMAILLQKQDLELMLGPLRICCVTVMSARASAWSLWGSRTLARTLR